MAIQSNLNNDTNNNNNNKKTEESNEKPYQSNQLNFNSLFNNGLAFGAAVPLTVGIEEYTKLVEKMKKITDSSSIANIEYIIIDRNTTNGILYYSAIIVVVRPKVESNKVSAYVMFMENSNDYPKAKTIYNGMYKSEIMLTPSDIINVSGVRTYLNDRLNSAFPGKEVYIATWTIVPKEFDMTNDSSIQQLTSLATLYAGTLIKVNSNGFEDFTAEIPQGNTPFLDVQFTRAHAHDSVGLPIRSDINLNLSIESFNRVDPADSYGLSTKNSVNNFSTITGYIDMLFSPSNSQMNFNPYAPPVTQKFIPCFVITNIWNHCGYTPGMVLLSLACSASLKTNNIWMQNYMVRDNNGKNVDLTDVGALNIEGNLKNNPSGYGEAPDTSDTDFTPDEFGRYMYSLVKPNMILALDVPECGIQSFWGYQFMLASVGSSSYNAIYKAAMQLTRGAFGKFFTNGSPIIESDNNSILNRIHLGYWEKDGVQRDIREIDYLAIANYIGKRDPQVLRRWTDSFFATSVMSAESMMDMRKGIIDTCTNNSAVYKGYARRVIFTSVFIDALIKGLQFNEVVTADAKGNRINGVSFNPNIRTSNKGMDYMQQRSIPNFVANAMLGNNTNFGQFGGNIGNSQMFNMNNFGNISGMFR